MKLQNHFINRFFIKNELLLPVIDVLESESTRDNMLTSACMEVLDLIRKVSRPDRAQQVSQRIIADPQDNAKPIINHIFESHRARLDALGQRPYLRQLVFGLTVRWQQNNEPPPPPVQPEAESSKAWERKAQAQEDDYFNASDDEDEASPIIGPIQPAAAAGPASTPSKKRRRNNAQGSATATGSTTTTSPVSRPGAPSPGKMASGGRSTGMGLVDYDDGSDSEGSSGAQSPVIKPLGAADAGSSPTTTSSTTASIATPDDQLEEDLGDVAMKMRAKRAREEEEEEGFAGLLGKAKTHAGPGMNLDTAAGEMAGKVGPDEAEKHSAGGAGSGTAGGVAKTDEGKVKEKEDEKKSWSAAAGAGGKKLRLNLTGAFKKLSK